MSGLCPFFAQGVFCGNFAVIFIATVIPEASDGLSVNLDL
jgi:hypothetical protein